MLKTEVKCDALRATEYMGNECDSPPSDPEVGTSPSLLSASTRSLAFILS